MRFMKEGVRFVVPLVLLFAAIVGGTATLAAQDRNGMSGKVVDDEGATIAGARISISSEGGGPARVTNSDSAGAFSFRDLKEGKYGIRVEKEYFATERITVDVPSPAAGELRVAMKLAGLTDALVVTAQRGESKISETPQQIQIVTSRDIERSASLDITDALKKNSGVDVIQYNGLLSGIGIRGFRPEFSGINKRSLLLIDGRPSGATNLAGLMLDNVDHVEVMKGPASSVYGASAMGGVVNIITKPGGGPLYGKFSLGYSSFATSNVSGGFGGSVTSRFNFDINFKFYDQRDDYRVGVGTDKRNGYTRPADHELPFTAYGNNDAAVRVGLALSSKWMLSARANVFAADDVSLPGDVVSEGNARGRKNFGRGTGDVRLQGQIGQHAVAVTGYRSLEHNNSIRVTSVTAADQAFLPFLTFEGVLTWTGSQLQDVWQWRKNSSLVTGFDSEVVSSVSRSYTRTGARSGPFSADNNKRTLGAYAQNNLTFHGGATALTMGARIDNIKVSTFDTPFKTGFTPSATTFSIFNPSVGVKQALGRGFRVHGTVGRAFVPADASSLTGNTTSIVGGRTQITQGNPDLKPERSASIDGGLTWASRSTEVDLTYFTTKVTDRIISNVVISNPAPPDPLVISYANAFYARMRGAELDVQHRFNRHISGSSSVTRYFTRKEQISTETSRVITVVAAYSLRTSVDVDYGPLTTRLTSRFINGRYDLDFNTAGNPIIPYQSFAVFDLNARYRLPRQQALAVTVNNMFDKYYYEKFGYPLAGRAVTVNYSVDLRAR